MLIDTHSHINFNAYKDDGDEVIARTLAQDTWLINVGSQINTSRRAIEYAKKYPAGVFAAVGLHPFHLVKQYIKSRVDETETVEFETRPEEFNYDEYKSLAQNDKVVAIGEVGLDYHYMEDKRHPLNLADDEIVKIKKQQKEVFKKQLELARELNKPVIVHCRNAHEDVLEILENFCNNSPSPRFASEAGKPPLNLRGGESTDAETTLDAPRFAGVIHSFSGRWSQAQKYLEMGFFLGFNGIITFARDYDRVVREAPLEKILLETDCPYLTPAPFRGKRNEPAYVRYVAEKIAELRGITFEEVAEQTTKNTKDLFKI